MSMRNQTFGEEKAGCQFQVVTRGAHGDADGYFAHPYLKRLFRKSSSGCTSPSRHSLTPVTDIVRGITVQLLLSGDAVAGCLIDRTQTARPDDLHDRVVIGHTARIEPASRNDHVYLGPMCL